MLCRVLAVSRSAYYAWCANPPSPRAIENARLVDQLREIHRQSRRTYGSPRVHRVLRQAGLRCSRARTERLMRQYGLRGQRPQRFIPTTQTGGSYAVADNLLARRFEAGALNALIADLTVLRTQEGYLWLAVVLSLRSRRVLGYAMHERRHSSIVLDALRMALAHGPLPPGTLHHSDRGTQYASHAYQALLAQHQLVPSMSRPANCYDNAVAESFFATLKRELSQTRPPRRDDLERLIGEWIECFYNDQRLHSSLGYTTPNAYEKLLV